MADPNEPFVIAGKTLDAFGNGVGNVTISLSVKEIPNESLSTTSSSNGEYTLNLADLTTQWVAGQEVNLSVSGYEPNGRTYTIVDGDTALNINQDFVMKQPLLLSRIEDKTAGDFFFKMSQSGRAFMKGPEEYTLTASFVNQTADGEFLEIPQDSTVYITGLIVGISGTTDNVVVNIQKASREDPTIADTAFEKVGRNIDVSPRAGPNVDFKLPIKIKYNSTSARSVVLGLKGGTADVSTVIFTGFVLGGVR